MKKTSSQNLKLEQAKRLIHLRNLMGFSQREMAQEFRVVHGAIGLWESGKRSIPGPVLLLLDLYEKELGIAPSTTEPTGLDQIKTSWLARSLEASTMTARIAGQVTWAGLKSVFSENTGVKDVKRRTEEAMALQIVEVLGQLKGLPMKMGQMVSYMDFNNPTLGQESFRLLQDVSTPLKASVIAEIIVGQFRKTPNQLFSKWESEPFSAASIGQVHQAVLPTGHHVAVKIQYPGIRKTLEADFINAEIIDKLGSLVFKGQTAGTWIRELRERLFEECDYKMEAANQAHFHELTKGHPHLLVPQVFPEFCSSQVLTTEFVKAQSFDKFLKSASLEKINAAASTIWDFAFGSIFRHGLFHGDPHPGNFLFQDGKVMVVDFGCVKRLSPHFIDLWKKWLASLKNNDRKTFQEITRTMGLAPKPEAFDFDYQFEAMKTFYEPWLVSKPYQFTPEKVIAMWKKIAENNPNKLSLNMPKDWILLNHLHWGVYSLLAHMKAKTIWSEIVF